MKAKHSLSMIPMFPHCPSYCRNHKDNVTCLASVHISRSFYSAGDLSMNTCQQEETLKASKKSLSIPHDRLQQSLRSVRGRLLSVALYVSDENLSRTSANKAEGKLCKAYEYRL